MAVYTHCMYCNRPLGSNEVIEEFPVGRRLAFDADKGRLWVVCRSCERWNLSPLEERWEAIEACERQFHDTRLRVSTDNIGMAKLREGLELVRVGKPQRGEFAAWRYGDQFGRRRRRQILIAGAGLSAIAAVMAGSAVMAGGIGGGGYGLFQVAQMIIKGSPRKVVARITTPHDTLKVRRKDLQHVALEHDPDTDGDWALRVRAGHANRLLRGEEARRAAGLILPPMNRYGGNKRQVQEAVQHIEFVGSPGALPKALLERNAGRVRRPLRGASPGTGLAHMPGEERLAFEMAMHEEAERRAMEGELWLLEQAWKDAERIASISDDLLAPKGWDDLLGRFRGK